MNPADFPRLYTKGVMKNQAVGIDQLIRSFLEYHDADPADIELVSETTPSGQRFRVQWTEDKRYQDMTPEQKQARLRNLSKKLNPTLFGGMPDVS